MKLSLVIEGGGLRGSFAIGALTELAKLLPVRPNHVYATSSGAPNAAYFAAGQLRLAVLEAPGGTIGHDVDDDRCAAGGGGSSALRKVGTARTEQHAITGQERSTVHVRMNTRENSAKLVRI